MSKYLSSLFVLTAMVAAPNLLAETIKKGMIGCVTEDLLSEAIRYASKSDMNGLRQLIGSGQCKILNVGDQVSIIDKGFITATLRYRGVKIFAPSEAVR